MVMQYKMIQLDVLFFKDCGGNEFIRYRYCKSGTESL